MRKTPRRAGLAIVVAILAGCHETDRVIEDGVPAGAYAYTGFDVKGMPIATGWMTLPTNPPTGPGEWRFQPTGAGDRSGHPLGVGYVRQDPRWVGPGVWESVLLGTEYVAYNDVDVVEPWRLSGSERDGIVTGAWYYSGVEISRSGTFRAVRMGKKWAQ